MTELSQQPNQNPSGTGSLQGLPPSGLQQQLNSLNKTYGQVKNASFIGATGSSKFIGFDPRSMSTGAQSQELQSAGAMGQTSLNQMAKSLAERYGLNVGRGQLVDEYGNMQMTPDQLAAASGGSETLGTAAAKMNYISQAITRRQNEEQQQKGVAAIQTGLGQVQSRGRGSMAAMQSGMYQDLADLYSNKEYEAADFSYFIQKEQLDMAAELQRRQESLIRDQAKGQFVGGAIIAIAGVATGNVALAAQGAGMAASSAGTTGWF